MADLTDVQTVLASTIEAAIYPSGTGAASVLGKDIIIYPGWPSQANLDADLAAEKCHVTIFPTAIERNTSRYPREWQTQSINTATLTATIAGQTVVIGGTMPSPFTTHIISVVIGNKTYAYTVQQSDTLTSIASALAALIVVDLVGTTSSGGTITLPNDANPRIARVGVTGTAVREIRRQERVFQITVWADTPTARDTVSKAIDSALAGLQFLTMPDGFAARLIYKASHVTDSLQKAKLYRRDFHYSVEYATTETTGFTQVVAEQTDITVQAYNGSTISTTQVNF